MAAINVAAKKRASSRVSEILGAATMKLLASDPHEAARRVHKARPWGPSVTEFEARIRQFQTEHEADGAFDDPTGGGEKQRKGN